MKSILLRLVLILVFMALVYCSFAYILLESNPIYFDKSNRFGFVLMEFGAIAVGFMVSLMIEDLDAHL